MSSIHHPTRTLGPATIRSRPLGEAPADTCAALIGVMTDIDDTLTRDGAIEEEALDALRRLREAGLPVIAITGRPMGWSLPFAAHWPLAAIVAENGAVALVPRRPAASSHAGALEPGERGGVNPLAREPGPAMRARRGADRACDPAQTVVDIEYMQEAAVREANARRLEQTAERILREVPGATLARDSAGRVTDIAIDHSEFTQLPPASIDAVVAMMREAGMTATVSSIHINGWFGAHSKWTGAQWMVRRLFGRDLLAEVDRWVYVGDSTNDQEMFQRFPFSVGVANLRHFADALVHWPAWITQAERGAGFAELTDALLAARQDAVNA